MSDTPPPTEPDPPAPPGSQDLRPDRSPPAEIVRFADLPGQPCPCGIARRAFEAHPAFPGTVHLTEIRTDAKTHYHRHHTEIYVVLRCDENAQIELDGIAHDVAVESSVLIPPGVRHRAIGNMTVLIVCHPEFDPEDEFFD